MKTLFRPALSLFIIFSIITGLIYPLFLAGIGKLFFPHQAAGSLIEQNGVMTGSELIGQNFTSTRYFWGRPSATSPYPYNAAASGGSNLGPLNPTLISNVTSRIVQLRQNNPADQTPVPVDLVTSSASGLDPDITPAAAFYQVERVAKARGLNREVIDQLVSDHIQNLQWGVFGEKRVNVLQLNRALDALTAG